MLDVYTRVNCKTIIIVSPHQSCFDRPSSPYSYSAGFLPAPIDRSDHNQPPLPLCRTASSPSHPTSGVEG